MPESSGWDIIFNEWKCSLYSDFISLVAIILALTSAIKFWRKTKLHILFLLYSVMALTVVVLLPVIGAVVFKVSMEKRSVLNEFANIVFLVVEFITLYQFFFALCKGKLNSKIFLVGKLSFIVSMAYLSFRAFDHSFPIEDLRHLVNLVFSLELLFFGCLSIFYFYDIVKGNEQVDLFTRPSFWIVAGLFLYCLAIVPFLLIAGIIEHSHPKVYNVLYAMHYVSLAIFFVTIARAFTLRRALTV